MRRILEEGAISYPPTATRLTIDVEERIVAIRAAIEADHGSWTLPCPPTTATTTATATAMVTSMRKVKGNGDCYGVKQGPRP